MIKKMVQLISILIIIFNFLYCVKNKYPESVPPNAIYSKKSNSYSLTVSGIKKVWNDKGQLFSQTSIGDSLRENGLSLTFFPETGAILSRGNFVEGKREGIWEWYFPDGKLYYRSGYSPDKQREVWISTNLLGNEHGIHERFYENGQLEEKGFYEFGLKIDKWEKYYKNGKLEQYGNYNLDKKIGEWTYLYPDGKIVAKEIYDKFGKIQLRSTFYPDGSKECTLNSSDLDCISLK